MARCQDTQGWRAEQAQHCSSLLSQEGKGARGLGVRSMGFGAGTASSNGPNSYQTSVTLTFPICQLGEIMLYLPHRMVMRIK